MWVALGGYVRDTVGHCDIAGLDVIEIGPAEGR
jgi:hypothetical protein